MAIIDYPPILPSGQIADYEVTPTRLFAETQMDNGHKRLRRRFTTAPTRYAVVWQFTPRQFGIFQAWFNYDLLDGANFANVHLLFGDVAEVIVVRFNTSYTANALADTLWKVSAKLERVQ